MTSKKALKMMAKKYNWLCEQYAILTDRDEMSLECNKKVFKDFLVKPVSQDLKKLNQLEDIEKELGIDLTTFYKNYKELLSLSGRNLRITIEELKRELTKEILDDN